MKEKENITENEDLEQKMPPFMFGYSFLVLALLIALFVILLLVVVLPSDGHRSNMINAVLIVQVFGLFYLIPFYAFPQIYSIVRYKKFRRRNITLASGVILFYSMMYPLFYLFLSILGR